MGQKYNKSNKQKRQAPKTVKEHVEMLKGTTEEDLANYKKDHGTEIMAPDGNRAYLLSDWWRSPFFLPYSKAKKEKRYPAKWIDSQGTRYEVYAHNDLNPNPDMGVLLGLVALWQDCMKKEEATICEIEGRSFVSIRVPMNKVYKATGYTPRTKHRLIDSLTRVASISVKVARKLQDGRHSYSFAHFFSWEYIAPEQNGYAGEMTFFISRHFIPKASSHLWHPARLCQRMKLSTSKLIFWGISSNIQNGWTGTVRDLYRLVQREQGNNIDPIKLAKWKARQLDPALKELCSNGFQVAQEPDAYDGIKINIKWPKATDALQLTNKETDKDEKVA